MKSLNNCLLYFLSLLIVWVGQSSCELANVTEGEGVHWEGDSVYQHNLIVYLFGSEEAKYRHYIKPPGQVQVNISVSFNRIIELDEVSQIITVVMWVRLNWVDENIFWDPRFKDFGDINVVRVPVKHLWEPDIVLWENVDDRHRELLASPTVLLTNTGHVTWVEPRVYRTICNLNIYLYPFDDHLCMFTFGSWVHGTHELVLKPANNANDISHFVDNNAWILQRFLYKATGVMRESAEERLVKYSTVTFAVHFSRRWYLPFAYLAIPTMLANAMSMVNLLVPVESNEKLGLGTTIFLSLVVYLLLLQQLLPPAEELPLIVIYITITLLANTINVLLNVFIIGIHHKGSHDNDFRAPDWLRHFVLVKLAAWVGLKRQITPGNVHEGKLNFLLETLEIAADQTDDRVQVKGNDVSVSPESDEQGTKARASLTLGTRSSQGASSDLAAPAKGHLFQQKLTFAREDLNKQRDIMLYKILKHCEMFKENIVARGISDTIQMEWRQIAMVLERLIFYIYVVVSLVLFYYLIYMFLFTHFEFE